MSKPPAPTAAPEAAAHAKIEKAAIAPRPQRRYRAEAFQAYVYLSAAIFVGLAIAAHVIAYFPLDLRITLALQANHGSLFGQLMYWVSWLGFFPQVAVLCGATVVALLLLGLRWEAVSLVFAAGAAAVGTLVKFAVVRPRPGADLVHVFAQLRSWSFPSGHVLSCTAFCGFLVFLAYTLLKESWWRTLGIALLVVLIALMGPSRIYQGQHWFSDVMGAYLLGSLWLALTTRFYRWGKERYFVTQPVAPAVPTPTSPPTPAEK